MTKEKNYETQNSKLWSLNFSKKKYVAKSKQVFKALKGRVSIRSLGLTAMLAVEYCLQERVVKDFSAYVDTKRRGLL